MMPDRSEHAQGQQRAKARIIRRKAHFMPLSAPRDRASLFVILMGTDGPTNHSIDKILALHRGGGPGSFSLPTYGTTTANTVRVRNA